MECPVFSQVCRSRAGESGCCCPERNSCNCSGCWRTLIARDGCGDAQEAWLLSCAWQVPPILPAEHAAVALRALHAAAPPLATAAPAAMPLLAGPPLPAAAPAPGVLPAHAPAAMPLPAPASAARALPRPAPAAVPLPTPASATCHIVASALAAMPLPAAAAVPLPAPAAAAVPASSTCAAMPLPASAALPFPAPAAVPAPGTSAAIVALPAAAPAAMPLSAPAAALLPAPDPAPAPALPALPPFGLLPWPQLLLPRGIAIPPGALALALLVLPAQRLCLLLRRGPRRRRPARGQRLSPRRPLLCRRPPLPQQCLLQLCPLCLHFRVPIGKMKLRRAWRAGPLQRGPRRQQGRTVLPCCPCCLSRGQRLAAPSGCPPKATHAFVAGSCAAQSGGLACCRIWPSSVASHAAAAAAAPVGGDECACPAGLGGRPHGPRRRELLAGVRQGCCLKAAELLLQGGRAPECRWAERRKSALRRAQRQGWGEGVCGGVLAAARQEPKQLTRMTDKDGGGGHSSTGADTNVLAREYGLGKGSTRQPALLPALSKRSRCGSQPWELTRPAADPGVGCSSKPAPAGTMVPPRTNAGEPKLGRRPPYRRSPP